MGKFSSHDWFINVRKWLNKENYKRSVKLLPLVVLLSQQECCALKGWDSLIQFERTDTMDYGNLAVQVVLVEYLHDNWQWELVPVQESREKIETNVVLFKSLFLPAAGDYMCCSLQALAENKEGKNRFLKAWMLNEYAHLRVIGSRTEDYVWKHYHWSSQ